MPRRTEESEWLEELISQWAEVQKKSTTTLVLLRSIREFEAESQPANAAALTERFTAVTGWTITERALYRTLRRLVDCRILESMEVVVPRTGKKRNDLILTALGGEYLERIEAIYARIS